MNRILLLLVLAVGLGGCDRLAREELKRAQAAAEKAADAVRETPAENRPDEQTVKAMTEWSNFVSPVDRPEESIDGNMRLVWELAGDPHQWSEVEIAALKSGVSPDDLLTTLTTRLADLPWAQLQNACFEGQAFRNFGSGAYDRLEWEAISTNGPDGRPVVTGRFRLVDQSK